MKCFHELNNQGICIKYLQRKIDLANITKTEMINIQEIEIFEQQPEIKVNEIISKRKKKKFILSKQKIIFSIHSKFFLRNDFFVKKRN